VASTELAEVCDARCLYAYRTTIAGAPAQGGQPLIPEGATVEVRGRRCAANGNLDGRLTALRIMAASNNAYK